MLAARLRRSQWSTVAASRAAGRPGRPSKVSHGCAKRWSHCPTPGLRQSQTPLGKALWQPRPLLVGERDRVVAAPQPLELALEDVVRQRPPGRQPRVGVVREQRGDVAGSVTSTSGGSCLTQQQVDRVGGLLRSTFARCGRRCGRPRSPSASCPSAGTTSWLIAAGATMPVGHVQMIWLSWSPLARSRRARIGSCGSRCGSRCCSCPRRSMIGTFASALRGRSPRPLRYAIAPRPGRPCMRCGCGFPVDVEAADLLVEVDELLRR